MLMEQKARVLNDENDIHTNVFLKQIIVEWALPNRGLSGLSQWCLSALESSIFLAGNRYHCRKVPQFRKV